MPVLTRWWWVDFARTDAAGRHSQLPYKGSSHAVPRTGSPEPSTAGQCVLGRQEVTMRPRVSRLAPWARSRRLNSICSRTEDGSNQACQHLSRRQHSPSAQGNTAAADKTVERAATEHNALHAAHNIRLAEQSRS
ncbi:hypothetical protein H4R99_007096 [Coemansia sp. RSA 1722]|nr:hypothetical protein IWW45_007642 [Coemansia sp. RSA 485]KAJ2590450.1 hypothetical protein H4R99_007096 [Coemansia sp. RSA 1722]KAJ2596870.1 hypothetical protein GGF39_003272 [Coemansia sp. RSA 1721]